MSDAGYDDIIDNAVIISGGGVKIVAGGTAKLRFRDRILFLEEYKKDGEPDIKKMLEVINMTMPISFSNYVEFNDGSRKVKIDKKQKKVLGDTEDIMDRLNERLNMKTVDVIDHLIGEFGLSSQTKNAMVELINRTLQELKKLNPSMKRIAISGDVGWLLNDCELGEKCFKINTDDDKEEDAPSTLSDVCSLLLECLNKKIKNVKGAPNPDIINPEWPRVDLDVLRKMDSASGMAKNSRVGDVISAIVKRENMLADYLDVVEKYYIDTAKDIYEYVKYIDAIMG